MRRFATLATVAFFGALALGASSAHAQVDWTGLGPDNLWTTSDNWSTVLTAPLPGDDARFGDGPAIRSVDATGTQSITNLLFTATGANNYTLSNGTINASGSLTQSGSATTTIGSQLAITGGINVSAGRLLLTNTANTVGGATSVSSGGILSLQGNTAGNSAITLTNSTLTIESATTNVSGLRLQMYSNMGTINNTHPIFTTGFASTTQAGFDAFFATFPASASTTTSSNGKTNLDYENAAGGPGNIFGVHNFNVGDNVAGRFTGKINIAADGDYTFRTRSDDGSVVYIDGNRIVDNNFFQGMNTRGGSVFLTAGLHDIAIGFYEGGGGAGLQVGMLPGIVPTTPPGAVIPPGDIIQNSILSATVPVTTALTMNNALSVSGSSTLRVVDATSATFPSLSMAAGATLNTQSGNTGGAVNFNTSTFAAGAATFNLAANANVSLGTFNASPITSLTKQGAGSLDARSGTGVIAGGSTITAQGGTLRVRGAGGGSGILGTNTVQLTGGTLELNGEIADVANALVQKWFQGTNNQSAQLDAMNNNGGFLIQAPTGQNLLTTQLRFDNDGQFQAISGNGVGVDNYAFTWTGTLTAHQTGNWQFSIGSDAGLPNNDDDAIVYIDINQNGVFEDANGEKVLRRNCCGTITSGNVALTAGQSYRVAFGTAEGVGGSVYNMSYRIDGGGGYTLINPGDAGQAGMWTATGALTPANFSANALNVTANSGLSIQAPSATTGTVTLNNAALTTSGATVSFANTVFNGANANLTVNGGIVTANVLTVSNPANAATLTKAGGGTLRVDNNTAASNLTATQSVRSNGGTLLVSRSATNNPIGTARMQLGGGTISLGGVSSTVLPGTFIEERYFTGTFTGNNDPKILFHQAGSFLDSTPNATNGLNRSLSLDGPVMNARSGGLFPSFDNIGAAFVGTITVGGPNLPAGDITFGLNSDDGTSWYIDLDHSNTYEDSERVVSFLGDHGTDPNGRIATHNIAAGTYNFAIGFYEGIGGELVEARFASGNNVAFGSQTIVNQTSLSQAGIWNGAGVTPGPVDYSGNTLSVITTGTLNVNTGSGVTVGALDIANAQTLNVTGGGLATFASTTGTTGSAAITINATANARTGRIVGPNVLASLTKVGVGDLYIDDVSAAATGVNSSSNIIANGGRVVIGANTSINAVNGAGIRVGSGTAALTAVVAGPVTFNNSVSTVGSSGTLRATAAGAGLAGQTINLTGSVAATDFKSMTIAADTNYTLNLNGAITTGLEAGLTFNAAAGSTIGGTTSGGMNNGTLRVQAGNVNLANANFTSTTTGSTLVTGLTQRWFYNQTNASLNAMNNNGGLLAATPAGKNLLTGNLNFGDDNAWRTTTNQEITQLDNFQFLWTGKITLTQATSQIRFGSGIGGAVNVDDDFNVFIDLNNDGIFTGVPTGAAVGFTFDGTDELFVRNETCCATRLQPTAKTVAAGTYNIAIGFSEGGGGNTMGLSYSLDNGANWFLVNPTTNPSAAQPVTFQAVIAGSAITVDAGASLTVKSFTDHGSANITGTLATAGTGFNSDVQFLNAFGAAATLNVGTGDMVTTQAASIAAAGKLTKSGAGQLSIEGTQTHGAGAILDTVAGTTNFYSNGGANLTVRTTGAAAVTNFGATNRVGSVEIDAGVANVGDSSGGIVLVTGGASGLASGGLTIAGGIDAWSGKLDIHANDVVLKYDNDATTVLGADRVFNQIKNGFNVFAWDGQGIISSAALNDASSLTTVGMLNNNDGFGGELFYGDGIGNPQFSGETVTAQSVLLKYTYFGDANLDGIIDGTDYALIDNGFTFSLTGWQNGDFDYSYDGINPITAVDGTDYSLIDNAFTFQGGPLVGGGAGGGSAAAVSAVPEPSSFVLLALGAALAGFSAWRKRRTAK